MSWVKVQYHLLLVFGTWLFREFQSTSLLKAIRLVKHDFPILDPYWPLQITLLPSCVWKTLSRRIFFITFPRTTVRLMVLYHPGPPLLPSLKIQGISALFQSSGTSPNYYDHSTTFKVHSSKKSGCHWTALRNHWRICMDSKSNRFVFLSYSRI